MTTDWRTGIGDEGPDPRVQTGDGTLLVYGVSKVCYNAVIRIKNKIDDLKTIMATGYDPTFSYTYDNHRVAGLLLNGVTLEVDEANFDAPLGGFGGASVLVLYQVIISIRVHTGYRFAHTHWMTSLALLSAINDYLNDHRDLGDDYRIMRLETFNPGQYFDESETFGGEIKIMVQKPVEHTQA